MDLLDLPHGVLHDILRRAGLRSRLACKALAHAYGPLHSLAPRGLTTTLELLSALASHLRHAGLKVLNLEHTADLVTGGSLQALCEALPGLQKLRLPDSSRVSLSRVASATASLTRLTALHLPSGSAVQVANADVAGRLSRLQALTLSTTSIAAATDDLRRFAALTELRFHAAKGVQHKVEVPALVRWAALLPALVSLQVDANSYGLLVNTAQLRALTALRTLKLACPRASFTTSELLQDIGSLTALRGLHLRLRHFGWAPAERGWLFRLSLLTSLHVAFSFPEAGDGAHNEDDEPLDAYAAAIDEVASAVPRLPALVELSICDSAGSMLGEAPSATAFARIASAASTLRLLHLQGLQLPWAATAALLPQLTALTCLHLSICEGLGDPRGWLAALTGLQELCCDSWDEDCLPPCTLLAGLTKLHTLGIQRMDGPYLAQLCAATPQLTCLDLGARYGAVSGEGLRAAGPAALRPLQLLTNLEVLDLSLAVQAEQVRELKGMHSLRRCYLGGPCPASLLKKARAALGKHVDVVPRTRQQEWWW